MLKKTIKYHIKDNALLLIEKLKLLLYKYHKPILVFTMAKVGSLSIYFSLKKASKKYPVFHIHSLSEKEVNINNKLCFDNGIYPGSKSPVFLINKSIIKKEKPYKIICLFRDPIDRNISAFFDAFELYVGVTPNKFRGEFSDLEKLYYEKLPHEYCINWFERQLYESTGIDVYASDFEKAIKYKLLNNGNNVELLLMNSDIRDNLKEKLISNFCDLPEFKLKNINRSIDKEYSKLFSDFKNQIKFSNEYLQSQYESKYATHFFTKEHICEAVNKWVKK